MLAAALRASRAPALAKVPRTCVQGSRSLSNDVLDILNSLPSAAPTSNRPPTFPPPKGPKQSKASTEASHDRPRTVATRLRLHCHSSPNNTIATLTKPDGSTLAWFSGGSCGFKKGNRATYEAGYQCAVRTFRKIEEESQRDGSIKDAYKDWWNACKEDATKLMITIPYIFLAYHLDLIY
ncbi:hypothetical protein FA13DRAFT_1811125 [Coprinellus micaceus]|uniref:Uncharacterized protein n=1 Tax=Coprinellus micaceus TaxID=71717 RepID=A0A4Y7TPG0_COPMI|nr:hypothetical protein FA13DRAFT_1811125 [Coprinellus micaceus]